MYVLILFLSATQSITPMPSKTACERVAAAAVAMATTGEHAWKCVPVTVEDE